jgi:murein DD-endopeptidase MepM/ murein hydrolase activator NlpD
MLTTGSKESLKWRLFYMEGERKGHYEKGIFLILLLVVILGFSAWYVRVHDKIEDINKVSMIHDVEPVAYKEFNQVTNYKPTEPIRKVYTLAKGDTFFEILKENGVPGNEALDIIKEAKRVFNMSKIHPGNEIVLVFSPDNQRLIELDYDISDLQKLVVTIGEDRIEAKQVGVDKEEHIIPSTDSPPLLKAYLPLISIKPTENAPPIQRTEHQAGEKQTIASAGLRQIDVTVKKGHSLFDILRELGVNAIEIDAVAKSVRKVYNLSGIKPGKILSVWLSQKKPVWIERLTYEIDDTNYLDVTSDHNAFTARIRTLAMDVRYERAEGMIGSSLYESAIAEGLNPEVVMELTDIFTWNINFFSDIKPGDTYNVLYEKYYVKDQFKGYGRVMAARFVNQGEKHVAIYYNNERRGIQGYFDENGKPLKKMFLKAPLNYRRISSEFSHRRLHPIYNVVRPHLGIDFAAPIGTPVCSLGPGKVVFKGWVSGFGETIRIRHPVGYVSYYGHLSRFAKGIKVGKKVEQGDVIGYVGTTGISTGPHLDFRVSCNGRFVNPLKLKSVNGPPLKGKVLKEFKHISADRLATLKTSNRDVALNTTTKNRSSETRSSQGG